MVLWQKILLVAGAGAAGTLARYGLSEAVLRWVGPASSHPWGTLACNLTGCLLFGVAIGVGESRLGMSEPARLLLLTGFMGAFTTFSTFAHEGGLFVRQGNWVVLGGHLLMHNLLGLVLLLVGFGAVRWFLGAHPGAATGG